jgi:preprotein translocase subunit SecG
MYVFLTVLIVIAAILLTLLVLVQNSKGGGLANGFAGGNQVMGAPRTANFLEKTTWTLIIIIAVLAIATAGFEKGKGSEQKEVSTVVNALETEPAAAPVETEAVPQTEMPAEMPVEMPAEAPAAE